MKKKKQQTPEEKENFISLISAIPREELNNIIKRNGKTKLAKAVINLKEIEKYE